MSREHTEQTASEAPVRLFANVNAQNVVGSIKKGLSFGAKHNKLTFPELPTFLLFLRVSLAIVLGVVCGAIPITGAAGLLTFGVVVGLGVYFYYTNILAIDAASYGENSLLSEGVAPGLGAFILTWAIVYNIYHVTSIKVAPISNPASASFDE